MFNVSAVPAKLEVLTAYSEKHGEDHVSGLALKLTIEPPTAEVEPVTKGDARQQELAA